MFDLVNELAIIGTTCFMVAVTLLWYSPLFNKSTTEPISGIRDDGKFSRIQISSIGAAYLVLFSVVAVCLPYAAYAGLGWWQLAVGLALVLAAGLFAQAVMAGWSWRYNLRALALIGILCIVGTFMLAFWPW